MFILFAFFFFFSFVLSFFRFLSLRFLGLFSSDRQVSQAQWSQRVCVCVGGGAAGQGACDTGGRGVGHVTREGGGRGEGEGEGACITVCIVSTTACDKCHGIASQHVANYCITACNKWIVSQHVTNGLYHSM